MKKNTISYTKKKKKTHRKQTLKRKQAKKTINIIMQKPNFNEKLININKQEWILAIETLKNLWVYPHTQKQKIPNHTQWKLLKFSINTNKT